MRMDEIKCVKIIKKNGNSLGVHLTQELKMLGIEYDDKVEITIKKL